jgi:peptide/nickel transport system permease protein
MRFVREIRANRLARLGVLFMALILSMVTLAPHLTAYTPEQQNLARRLEPPSSDYWFGTDEAGRDIFTRVAYGGRVSLFVGLTGTAGGLMMGITIGLISGYFGGKADLVLMRFIDLMYAFPGVLLAILIVSVLGPNLSNLIVALAIWGTPTCSRIVRAGVLATKEQEFVEAARATGASGGRIMTRHLLLNTVGPIIVNATLSVAGSILTAAGMGFLGLGVQPPTPEWGAMLSVGRQFLLEAPHLCVFPGLAIFFTVLSLNFIGDALRDALDPYAQTRGVI